MPSKLKSNRRKRKMVSKRVVPKPEQQRPVVEQTSIWFTLPLVIMINILQRVGVFHILENAQKVCKAWREICKDPVMWRVIRMDVFSGPDDNGDVWRTMCRNAVNRSQGQLVDLTMIGFCGNGLLQYVADRSSQLKRLEIIYMITDRGGISSEPFKKLSALEELSLVAVIKSKDSIEAIGRYCPLLKTLKLNLQSRLDYRYHRCGSDEVALKIGENFPKLTHLELIGNSMQNIGLQAILDGCRHLESLDLRRCLSVDLEGDLGKRCSQQIKHLKLPNESVEGWPYDDDDLTIDRTLFQLWFTG